MSYSGREEENIEARKKKNLLWAELPDNERYGEKQPQQSFTVHDTVKEEGFEEPGFAPREYNVKPLEMTEFINVTKCLPRDAVVKSRNYTDAETFLRDYQKGVVTERDIAGLVKRILRRGK